MGSSYKINPYDKLSVVSHLVLTSYYGLKNNIMINYINNNVIFSEELIDECNKFLEDGKEDILLKFFNEHSNDQTKNYINEFIEKPWI